MKVAIIGAGISGLTCAIELERHGIKPVIFERRAHVGEALDYTVIWPRIMSRPKMDPLKYLKWEYSLELTPLNHIKKIIMFSPNHKAVERGSLGYIFKRGYGNHSMEKQLLNQLKSPVTFNTYVEAADIKNEFDYIVAADAHSLNARNFGVWTETFNAYTRVAAVLGKFNPGEIIMWLDTEYAKNGFSYLVPASEKEAYLVQIINGITSHELDYYWKQFLFTENINYYISSTTDAEHDCGFVQPLQADNVLFTGNAAGFTDDLIGCGGFNAAESGFLAARAMIYGKDYNTLAKPIYENIVKLHEFRKALNTMDNRKIDTVIKLLGLPILKRGIYNNPNFKLSDSHNIAKLYNKYVSSRRTSVE